MTEKRYTAEAAENGGYIVEVSGNDESNQWVYVKHVFIDRASMLEFLADNL